MQPLRVMVVAGPDTGWMDWERRLFAAIAADAGLEFVGVRRTAAPVRPMPGRLYRRALGLEARIVTPGKAAPLTEDPPEAAADARADVVLSHLRGGWPDPVVGAETWGYDVLTAARLNVLGVAEALADAPITRIALLRRTETGADCLDLSETNTKICASFTAAYALDKLVPLVLRALRRRHRGAGFPVGAVPEPRAAPGAAAMPVYAAGVARRLAGRALAAFRRRRGARLMEWSLFVAPGDPLDFDPAALTELPQPAADSRADPFLFVEGGATWVFFEAFSHRVGKGRLGVGRLAGDRLEEVREIDLGPGHLSYPFVFRHDGEIYMMPETSDRDRVEIWRCTAFPDRWTRHATALVGRAPADCTLVQHDGAWWLMANLSSGAFTDQGQELHLFRTDGPDLAQLIPHPDNPVVLGTATARNAGRPFVRDGHLFRPAQVASHGIYGRETRIMRVDVLTDTAFSESCVRSIRPVPDSGTEGCHHVDCAGGIVVLDARRADGAVRRAGNIALEASAFS